MSEGDGPVLFRSLFGTDPQAVGRAHGRVNLIGEHTDYNDGLVMPAAIPQQTVVYVSPGDSRFTVHSAALGRSISFGLEDKQLTDFGRYVGGCLRVLSGTGVDIPPLDMLLESDVPIGAGLSSSAALEVATIQAVDALLGLALSPDDVAHYAWRAETEHAGVACGIMDQIASSLASSESMLFLDTLTLERRLLPLPAGGELLVVDSGVARSLAASGYNQRRQECEAAAAALGLSSLREMQSLDELDRIPELLARRARHVFTENGRVLAAIEADAVRFGELMNGSHRSLRDDFEVSVPAVDALVAELQSVSQVFGARMTGAGFGGACVALVASGQAQSIGRACLESPEGHRRRVIVPPHTVPRP